MAQDKALKERLGALTHAELKEVGEASDLEGPWKSLNKGELIELMAEKDVSINEEKLASFESDEESGDEEEAANIETGSDVSDQPDQGEGATANVTEGGQQVEPAGLQSDGSYIPPESNLAMNVPREEGGQLVSTAGPEDPNYNIMGRDPALVDPSIGKGPGQNQDTNIARPNFAELLPEEGSTVDHGGVEFSAAAREIADRDNESSDEEWSEILEGTFVRLSNELETADGERSPCAGAEAVVVRAPLAPMPQDLTHRNTTNHTKMLQPPDTLFTVRTRDQYSMLINVTRDDFEEVSNNGRAGLLARKG